jgi:hypothetical protein
MTKPIIRIHDLATDEVIDREMNNTEYTQHLKDVAESETRKAAAEAREAQRQVILDRLGLTSDEARLLLGS